jgi:1-acyl-sn-glycerol-3-phosphate acyltransferase
VIDRIGASVRAAARVGATGLLAGATIARASRMGEGLLAARRRSLLLQQTFARTCALHGLRVHAAGPIPSGGVLLASNHVSYLDPVVVGSIVPCVPVSKADVSGWPVFGAVARRLGVLFHERGSRESGTRVLQAADAVLAGGLPVLNFPEGTTSTGETVLRFHRGMFGLAQRTGVPVVPVAIAYDPAELAWVGDATFVPHYLRLAQRPGAAVRITFGAPVPPLAYQSAGALADAVRDRIAASLEAAHAAADAA